MSIYNFDEFSNLPIIKELDDIIKSTNEKIEGNCLYENRSYFNYHRDNKESLRKNIFALCKKNKSILEVGFNGGHSVALYLYSNPKIKIKTFDICFHRYTEKCANHLKSNYDYDFELIKGDSLHTLKEYNNDTKFDLIHIDGGHGYDVAKNDLLECKKFRHKNTLIIFDDAYGKHIQIMLEEQLKKKFIKEVNYKKLKLEKTKYHRIFYYTN